MNHPVLHAKIQSSSSFTLRSPLWLQLWGCEPEAFDEEDFGFVGDGGSDLVKNAPLEQRNGSGTKASISAHIIVVVLNFSHFYFIRPPKERVKILITDLRMKAKL